MLGLRIDDSLERKLDQLARRTGRSKSELARDAIRRYVDAADLDGEARRQSLLVSAHDSDEDYLPFDDSGWTA